MLCDSEHSFHRHLKTFLFNNCHQIVWLIRLTSASVAFCRHICCSINVPIIIIIIIIKSPQLFVMLHVHFVAALTGKWEVKISACFCCCRYDGSAKHIRIQHSNDGSYYLASCHMFPTIPVCTASLVLVILPLLITVFFTKIMLSVQHLLWKQVHCNA